MVLRDVDPSVLHRSVLEVLTIMEFTGEGCGFTKVYN
jgi:hypothetical protein